VAKEDAGVEKLCQTIEQALTAMGGLYQRAHTGAEALTALRRERPLIIMLALSADFGDGDELLSGLRHRADLDDVPVLALIPDESSELGSGGQGAVAKRAYRHGASDVLMQGMSGEVLTPKLIAWLQLAGRAHRLWAQRDFAHEARHPIAAIGAAAHLLEVSGDDPSERQRLSHAIVSESERLGRMVESYLDADAMFRIGDAPLTESPFRLLTDLLEVSLAAPLRARVKMHVSDELPDLAVDPDQLRQMVLNLLDNALAATTHGGVVTIEAVAEPEGVLLLVRDTGSGIPEEHLGRIFENGFSTRGDRRRGLGLGITQRLCARVGGRIEVKSLLGEGTVFSLWLPRSRPLSSE
jgi:signal transduction histidine kinase